MRHQHARRSKTGGAYRTQYRRLPRTVWGASVLHCAYLALCRHKPAGTGNDGGPGRLTTLMVGIGLWHPRCPAGWAHTRFGSTVWSQLCCLVKERASLAAQAAAPALQEHRFSRVYHTVRLGLGLGFGFGFRVRVSHTGVPGVELRQWQRRSLAAAEHRAERADGREWESVDCRAVGAEDWREGEC